MEPIISLVGRILISAIFLISALSKISDFEGTQGYMATHGMSFTALFLVLAIIFEAMGGLAILLGCKAKLGALLLIIFLVPTTIVFHTNFEEKIQIIMFLKNLAILGGLLFVFGFGPGTLSFDERKKRKAQPVAFNERVN